MANKEQLEILKQGVEVWNQWREDNPDERPDLYAANLSGANLRKANFEGATLTKINFEGVNIGNANLKEADLAEANLRRANLRRVNLRRANLRDADLAGTDLWEASLSRADLRGADLAGSELWGTDFVEANLRRVNLRRANLVKANLSKAEITGVNLYGTSRDDWNIDGIICDYVFWDLASKQRTPKDRNFRPREFEELYKQLPTFAYYFEHGFTALDAVVMSRVVQAINERYPEFELTLDSFHSRGQPHAKFTVSHKENIEEALKQVAAKYETQLQVLEGQKEQLMKVIAMIGSGGITIGDVEGGVTITAGQDIIAGNKEQRSITAGRDYLEIKGQAKVNQVTTGDSFQDQAQQLIQTPLPQPQMDHLNTKEECTAHYQLLNEKLSELRKAYIIEADTEVKFKLKKKIEEAETDLNAIEQRLEALGQEKK